MICEYTVFTQRIINLQSNLTLYVVNSSSVNSFKTNLTAGIVKMFIMTTNVILLELETELQVTNSLQSFCRQAWLSDNEFITDNNLAYVKAAVIRDKQHYVCSENSLYSTSQDKSSQVNDHQKQA